MGMIGDDALHQDSLQEGEELLRGMFMRMECCGEGLGC